MKVIKSKTMSQSDQGLLHKKKLIFFPKDKDNTPFFYFLVSTYTLPNPNQLLSRHHGLEPEL